MNKYEVSKYIVLASLGVLAFAVTPLFAGATSDNGDEADPPGKISFIGSNKLSESHGIFETWRIVTANIDSTNPEQSTVELEVDISSLNTGLKMRDNHLREEEFFFVEKHPTASVKVYDFQLDSDAKENTIHYTATMDISIRGVKKTMPLTFEVTKESPYTVSGTCELDRTDFGIGKKYNGWNPMSVNRKIVVEFSATIPEPIEADK